VANAPGRTSASAAYCTYPALEIQTFIASRLSRPHPASDPGSQNRTMRARNGRLTLPRRRLPRNVLGSFTCRKSTTWDPRFYFPTEGRRAEDFFALKNPTASTANLGTKGQRANP
jgi:hypothetical protein